MKTPENEIAEVAASTTSDPKSPASKQEVTEISTKLTQEEPEHKAPVSSPHSLSGIWPHPATIQPNKFKYKSLSAFSFNTAVGCTHGCRFCYVPSTSTNKQAPKLVNLGVNDPDGEWGNYVFVREWDESAFLKSLRKAQETPDDQLPADGNRAVMFCSTTDPYQVVRNVDSAKGRQLTAAHQKIVRTALELIRDKSDLNVRILTRSPLAKLDFDVMRSFGPRLLFGMSLPTLNDKLARIYEPHAPAASQRLDTLKGAKEAGLNAYVAIAPTYPECDRDDLQATLTAVAELEPVTVFHEPINVRAENVERIRVHAEKLGATLSSEVFSTGESWRQYAIAQLQLVERLSIECGVADRLHLWPDKTLGSKTALAETGDAVSQLRWLQRWWTRVSEWPQ